MSKHINILFAIIATFVMAGCESPLDSVKNPVSSASGATGTVLVSIQTPETALSAPALTIYPALDGFTRYELSFSDGPAAHASVAIGTGVNSPIELVVGNWTITATAYKDTTASAQGSATVTVNAGTTTSASITLGPVTGGAAGTLGYSVTSPSGATGSLTIQTISGEVTGGSIALAAGTTTANTLSLPSGEYMLFVNLTKGGNHAGRSDVLHIYSGLTSVASYTFTDDDFIGTETLAPVYTAFTGLAGVTLLPSNAAAISAAKGGNTATFAIVGGGTGVATIDGATGELTLVAGGTISVSLVITTAGGVVTHIGTSATVTVTALPAQGVLTPAIIADANMLSVYIAAYWVGGTAEVPKLMKFNGAITPANLDTVRTAVNTANTYVIWDLSDVTGRTAVQIGNTINSSYSNSGKARIKGLVLPSTLTRIEDNAFWGSTGLTGVTIPNSVTSIGQLAFYGCSSLNSVTIPGRVASIGDSVFSGCTSLSSVTLSIGLTTIGSSAFQGCTSLTNISLPSTLTSINGAFWGCGLTSVTIPANVTSIGYGTFSGCIDLTSVTILGSVTSIGDEAFYCCRSLTSITIPASVTSIGELAFAGCSDFASVAIPANVTDIEDGAFSYCSSLTAITVAAANTAYSAENGILYNKAKTAVISVPGAKSGVLTLPSTLTSIRNYTFAGCSGLTGVTIPASVTSIGDYSFEGCGFISVTIPASVTSIGLWAFNGCNGLQTVVFDGNGVTIYDDGVFPYNSTSLKAAYEAGKSGSTNGVANKGVAGTYRRSTAGSWSRP
jgi:hypothetical protein